MNDYWDSDLKVLNKCGQAPENLIVYIKPLVKRKIDLLMSKYKSREWLAYLIGENNIVEDLYFPKQVATTASINNIDTPADIKIIGVIHSHHTMGTFFSETDHEYINSNHDISIVVSNKGFGAQVRWNTPCGCKVVMQAKVRLYFRAEFDEKEFLEEVEEKMVINQPNIIYPSNRGYFNNRFMNDESWNLSNVNPTADDKNEKGDGESPDNNTDEERPPLRDILTQLGNS